MKQLALAVENSTPSLTPQYDAMLEAIEACNIDELFKEIDTIATSDLERALAVCINISRNTENERRAGEIRLRAARGAGLMLKAIEKTRSTARCE